MTATDPAPRTITYVRLTDVAAAKRNAKRHDLPGIMASMRTLGFTEPPLIDERTHRLIAGHGRHEALTQMHAAGNEDPPAGILVDDDGMWLMPVTRGWTSHDDAHAEAAILLANRLPELGGNDARDLAPMAEDLLASDPALFDLLQFSDDDMDALVRAAKVDPDEDLLAAPLLSVVLGDGPDDAPLAPRRDERDDEDDLGTDHGMTDVPDGPRREKVRCPECGHHFRPGDR
ncbi:ParB N-terminal domain-containing protein [Cellulosimicrobium cellulans]|uniref:ParB N-terminal domain-containing protein n=1 Tax=Cellulosimicrobium cellulans TaxID=1710 RepID=UPI0035D9EAFE